MMTARIPQGPRDNPSLDEGIYDATIVNVKQGTYGADDSQYIQVIMRLPKPGFHFVTNFYLPQGKPDTRTLKRLTWFTQCFGLVPQDVLDSPQAFKGQQLKVQIKQCQNQGYSYCDVELFLHPDAVIAA